MPVKTRYLLLCAVLFLAGCKAAQPGDTLTVQPGNLNDSATQTIHARLTSSAAALESAAARVPSQTPAPNLAGTVPTPLESATPTAVPTRVAIETPVITFEFVEGEYAEYVADMTVPDGMDFTPGEPFTKTWRAINIGDTTWTTDYALAFDKGDQMGGPDRVNLLYDVAPGELVDLSLNLIAPTEPGNYVGYWQMVNASGASFEGWFIVEIDVVEQLQPTVTSTRSTLATATLTPALQITPTITSIWSGSEPTKGTPGSSRTPTVTSIWSGSSWGTSTPAPISATE